MTLKTGKEYGDWLIAKDIETQSDRGCAILAGAYLDEKLNRLLWAKLATTDDKLTILQSLTRPEGAMGNLRPKIDLIYLLDLCSFDVRGELRKLVSIRNAFAHRTHEAMSFATTAIRDACGSLRLDLLGGEKSPRTRPLSQQDARIEFVEAISRGASCLESATMNLIQSRYFHP